MSAPPPPLHPAVAACPRPAARADLVAVLGALGIGHATTEHPPVFTVEEGADIKAALPGGHSKNLFLKSKSGELLLICALGETAIRLNALHPVLGTDRLSFGKPELLEATLGVTPGSVTLFALLNDRDRAVRLILDAALLAHDIVNFHPLRNDATTAIASADVARFIAATGRVADIVDFAIPAIVGRLEGAAR